MTYQVFYCKANPDAQFVLLSSGLGGHGHFWHPQLDILTRFFHVITYDQQGCHADAALLAPTYSMTDMAIQVLQILEDLKIDEFHFIGHALGGHIGAELAVLIKNTKLEMLSLTSINAWDSLDPHTLKCFEARESLLQNAGAEAYVRAQALFLYPPVWISVNIDQIQQAENNQLRNFPPKENVLRRLKALKEFKITNEHITALQRTPIHLIANRDDFLVPVHKTLDLQKNFVHAQCSIFDVGAHASTVTEPNITNQALIQFLRSL